MELKEYLESKGLDVHKSGSNLVFDCPFCADDRQRCGINVNSNHAHFDSWNCFNCFPAYTPVATQRGCIPIKNVVVGDSVLTHYGTWEKVLEHKQTGIKKELIRLDLTRFGEGFDVTNNHSVFGIRKENVKFGRGTSKQQYTFGDPVEIKAKDLQVGDWLVMPRNKDSGKIKNINLNLSQYQKRTGPKPKKINEHIKLDKNFGFLVGLYIAEGSYNRGPNYSLNKSEIDVINKCEKLFTNIFDLQGKSYEQGEHNQNKSFWVGHTLLGRWFVATCGHLSENKKLPDFIFQAPIEFQQGVLDGIDTGDGVKHEKYKRITTTSRTLAYQLRVLLTSLGKISGLSKRDSYISKHDGGVRKKHYNISYNTGNCKNLGGYIDDDFAYYRISNIKKILYGNYVYDMTINNNHTYTAYGFSVHNCNMRGKSVKSFQKEINKLNEDDIREKIEIKKAKEEDEEDFEIDQKKALKHFNKAQKKKRKSWDYLQEERGFSKKTINHFMLGSYLKKKKYEYVSIPFWENGELVNVKYRAIKVKDKKFKWLRVEGGKTGLFHDEAIDHMDRKEVYICEAEFDAIALWNAGIKNVIGMSAGAKHGIPPEWIDRVEKFETIYLVFDNDVDGQVGAEKMATRLGMNRCYNVVLPSEDIIEDRKKARLKDLNQYFWDKDKKKERYSIKKFKKLVRASKKFQIKDVMSLTQTYHEMIKDIYTCNEDELIGFKTPWKRVNDILPAAKLGMLIVVTANPKVGKTTWVMNWFLSLAGPDCPCHIECYEMRQKKIAQKTIAHALPDFTTVENITELQIREARFINPSDYLFIGYPADGNCEFDALREKIIKIHQRYGVKMFCVDHLHFLIRGDNVKDKIGEVTRGLKVLAEMLGIVIVLVAQPRKVENNRVPTPNDLKDSSSIFQDLDSLVIIHRRIKSGDDFDAKETEDSKGKMESVTEIHTVSRWGDGGSCLLNFKGKKSKYYEKGIGYDKAVKKFIEKRKGTKKRGKK